MKAAQFREHIEKLGKIAAVQKVRPETTTEAQADAVIRIYVQQLLDHGNYIAAAVVLWGVRIFDARPKSVRQIWSAIEENSTLFVQGCASAGKSYTMIAWLLLDWWRDPQYTSVKLISTTSGHAKAQTFSTMAMLHKEAIIRMPGDVFSEHIGLEPSDKRASISIVSIPQGDDGKGRLQGFHPIPRPQPHATLGTMSRVRCMIDEAEPVPIGVWLGIDNMLSNISGVDLIKVMAAYNPTDIASLVGQMAEPKNGWESFDPETSFSWTSKAGWSVLRIDGKQLENIVAQKLIYDGQQTWEGYRKREMKHGGNNPEHWTMGRGAYPPNAVCNNIITFEWLNNARGSYTFSGPTVKFGGGDTAVEGRDDAILAVGRYGEASGFTHESGRVTKYPTPRMCLQIDQIIEMVKGSTAIVAHSFRDNCKMLGIAPGSFCMDRTGNGATVHDLLCEREVWSPDVMGVDFNKAATDMKILEQDQETAEEIYSGIVTEVWFALARWMEAGYVAVSPGVVRERLNAELLGRKYKLKGKLYRVLSKDEMKLIVGHSPDEADAVTLLLHAVRQKTRGLASMTGKSHTDAPVAEPRHGVVDRFERYNDEGI